MNLLLEDIGHLNNKKNRFKSEKTTSLASTGFFFLFFLIYVLPLATQVPEFARSFLRIVAPLRTPGALACASLITITFVSLLGALIFNGWRAAAWCALMLMFALAMIRAETARRQWTIWGSAWTYTLFQSYLLQMAILALVPLQVFLFKRKQPIMDYAQLSLGFVVAFQSIVTVTQFFMLRAGTGEILSQWGIASASLYTPRDSHAVYTGASRLTGLVSSPTLLGMLLTITWPALLITSSREKTAFFAIVGNSIQGPLMVAAVWAIILTYTRAAYIGLTLQCFAILLLTLFSKRNRIIWLINSLILLCGVITALLIIPSSAARVAAISDGADASITHRLAVYKIGAMLLAEHPLFGWGPGFFNTLYNNYYKLPGVSYSFYDTHSAVLNTVMEIGVLGVVLGMLVFCGTAWKTLFQNLPIWAWLGVLGVAIPVSVDNPSCSPAFMFPAIWIIGIWSAVAIMGDTDRTSKTP